MVPCHSVVTYQRYAKEEIRSVLSGMYLTIYGMSLQYRLTEFAVVSVQH